MEAQIEHVQSVLDLQDTSGNGMKWLCSRPDVLGLLNVFVKKKKNTSENIKQQSCCLSSLLPTLGLWKIDTLYHYIHAGTTWYSGHKTHVDSCHMFGENLPQDYVCRH